MLRQYCELPQDQRQFMVLGRLEVEHDFAVVLDSHVLHIRIIRAIGGQPLLDQRAERPGDILGRHRRAVVEPGFRPQRIGDRQVIGRHVHRLAQMAIHRRRLVVIDGHQRVIDLPHARRRAAADDEPVEAVERAQRAAHHRAALRRIRVGIREMREIRRQLRRPEQRQAVGRFPPPPGWPGAPSGQGQGAWISSLRKARRSPAPEAPGRPRQAPGPGRPAAAANPAHP